MYILCFCFCFYVFVFLKTEIIACSTKCWQKLKERGFLFLRPLKFEPENFAAFLLFWEIFGRKKTEMCFWRLEYYFEILPFHLMKTQERINCITFLLISFLKDLSLARSTWFNCCQNLVKQEKQKRTKRRKTSNYLFLSLMTIRSVTQMTVKILEFAFGTITLLGIWRILNDFVECLICSITTLLQIIIT